MLCSGLAVLSIPALFIGLPFVLVPPASPWGCSGGGDCRRLAVAALALGGLVVLFSIGVYAVLGDSDG